MQDERADGVTGRTDRLCAELDLAAAEGVPAAAAKAAAHEFSRHLDGARSGSRSAPVDRAVGLGLRLGGTPTVALPGRAEQLDPWYGAHACALAAVRGPSGRVGSPIFGAALAAGQQSDATAQHALSAYAAGRECQLRLARMLSARWDVEAAAGVLGAALCVGIIRGLERSALAGALGIAASETLGPLEPEGSELYDWQPARAAANGLLAALLAEGGFTSADDVVDADRGLFAVLGTTGSEDAFGDAEWLLASSVGDTAGVATDVFDVGRPLRSLVVGHG